MSGSVVTDSGIYGSGVVYMVLVERLWYEWFCCDRFWYIWFWWRGSGMSGSVVTDSGIYGSGGEALV